MSAETAHKLKEEKEALARELKLRESAVPPSEAASMIADAIHASKVDPILSPDNEWTGTGGKTGNDHCCILM